METKREEIIMRIENHVMHPEHPLMLVGRGGGRGGSDRAFMCDGCNQPGNGCSYQCYACDFVLHHYCATCPPTISFVSHNLKFVCNNVKLRSCDVCGTDIDGVLLYRCETEKCDFDVHPLCTQLPELIRHLSHPDHLLRLQRLSFGTCRLCKNLCTANSWGYRCQLCDFNLHLPCLSKSPTSIPINWFGFLESPFTILLVLLSAFMVFLMLRAIDQRYNQGAYSVHSYHFYPRR